MSAIRLRARGPGRVAILNGARSDWSLQQLKTLVESELQIPTVRQTLRAGFPPALIPDTEASTLAELGIIDGDTLLVDETAKPEPGGPSMPHDVAAAPAPQPEAQWTPDPTPGGAVLALPTAAPAASTAPLLIVLDLDGTLLSASRVAQRRAGDQGRRLPPPTFTVRDRGGYDVWLRPGCADFLSQLLARGCDLAVWTAAPAWYATMMVDAIESHAPCAGLVSKLRAVFCEDQTEVTWSGSAVVKKELRLLARKVGMQFWRCLVVDDTPSTYSANVSNALPVETFRPQMVSDDTLPALASFLTTAATSTPVDVRGWRHASSRARPLMPEHGHVMGAMTGGTASASTNQLVCDESTEIDDSDDDDDIC